MKNLKPETMQYRSLGKSGIQISVLSFGAMKWDSEEDAYNTLNHGMDMGMNYVDTSSGYIGGKSEQWIGKAVKHRRDDIYVSSKSNWNKGPDESFLRATVDKHLENTGLDHLDMYQIWNLNSHEALADVLKKGGTWDGIQRLMDEGIIKEGLGFTYHGTPDVFKAAVDSGIFLSATVSYNVLNRKEEDLINYAHENGVGTIIMNPLAGGKLGFGRNPKLDFLKQGGKSCVHGSLGFLLANPRITTSILGVSYPEQIDEDCEILKRSETFTEAYRQELITQADALEVSKEGFCTGCQYCNAECPNEVKPASIMTSMRDFYDFEMAEEYLRNWLSNRWIFKDRVDGCTECGLCEAKCPQQLPIVEEICRAKEAWSA